MKEMAEANPAQEYATTITTSSTSGKASTSRVARAVIRRLPRNQTTKGIRSPHFWAIVALMAILTLIYYAGYTPLARLGGFFTVNYPHDIHRALFVLPVMYAAITFRTRGAVVTTLVFLCIVLPRAVLGTPYPTPLARALVPVVVTAIVGFLTVMLADEIERERKIRSELAKAYQCLGIYVDKLKESQEQLIKAERLTSLGQMAGSVAHEINNPLAGVLTYIKLLQRKLSGDTFKKEEASDYLTKMETELGRCSRIIRNLLDFTRQSEPRLGLIDVNQVLEKVLTMVGHQAELQHVEIVREYAPSLPKVKADADQLQQVFTNLTLNAIQAMAAGGKLTLRTSVVNGRVRIDVQDTGCGISKENMAKLFTPFFTTKEKGSGVGLGLAVVRAIIERHKGEIKVESEVGEGTTFSVYLGVHGDEKS